MNSGLGAPGKRFLMLASAAALLCPAAYAAPPTPPNRAPVQAELVRPLEAGRIKPGDSVLAKVAVEWKSADCALRKGSVLRGRIVAASERSKTAKNSEIAVLFETAECGGRAMKAFPLTVSALLASDPRDADLYEGQQSQPLSEAVGLGLGGGANAGSGGSGGSGSGMRSVFAAAATAYVEPPRFKAPKAVLPGQVIGMGSLKLSVGSGPEGSSVLTDAKRNVRLEAGTQLVLVPSLKGQTLAATVASAATSDSVYSFFYALPACRDTIGSEPAFR